MYAYYPTKKFVRVISLDTRFMTIYVDNVKVKWAGSEWCHLVADSLDELHSFASKIGLRRQWFQGSASYPHYDIKLAVRTRAIQLGAVPGSRKQIIECAKKLKVEYQMLKADVGPQLNFLF
jgi:hypothetical protein